VLLAHQKINLSVVVISLKDDGITCRIMPDCCLKATLIGSCLDVGVTKSKAVKNNIVKLSA